MAVNHLEKHPFISIIYNFHLVEQVDLQVSPFYWGYAVGLFVSIVIICLILYYIKQFDINISEDKISGPGPGFAVRKTFSITDFDKSSGNKQMRLDKIVIGQVLQSLNGEKIIISSFIYDDLEVKKIQRLLEKD